MREVKRKAKNEARIKASKLNKKDSELSMIKSALSQYKSVKEKKPRLMSAVPFGARRQADSRMKLHSNIRPVRLGSATKRDEIQPKLNSNPSSSQNLNSTQATNRA